MSVVTEFLEAAFPSPFPWAVFLVGAVAGALVLSAWEFLLDARRIGRRPGVVTARSSVGGGGDFELVSQRDLGLGAGAGVKLFYQYRLLGTNNCLTRLLLRLVVRVFNKKREPCSPEKVIAFAKANGIPLEGWDRNVRDYPSIDAFFTRKYQSMRLRTNPEAIVSPSEGTVVAYTSVSLMQRLWVKQKACTLANMGVPQEYLGRLEGGTVCCLKLDVHNLHRFYAPVAGKIVARVDHLEPLRLSHSVRPFALQAGLPIMTENRRVVLVIENPFIGPVVMMIVGGIGIDSIEMLVEEGEDLRQGQEVGLFHMGGSAILLAMPRDRVRLKEVITVCSLCATEFGTRVGDELATII